MKSKNTLFLIGSILLIIAILSYNFNSGSDDLEQEYSDSEIFDTSDSLDFSTTNYDANAVLVSCDTIVRYWENINTEEQIVSKEVRCDTVFLHCDSTDYYRENNLNGDRELVVVVKCDTLYTTENY